jgi:hypothetical protein
MDAASQKDEWENMESEAWKRLVAILATSVLAGLANDGHLRRIGKHVTWGDVILRLPLSGLIGLLCWQWFPKESPTTGVVAGVLSWMGAGGSAFIISTFVKKNDK